MIYGFISYPESTTDHDLVEGLKAIGLPCAISPRHDKDTYADDVIDKETGLIVHRKGDIKKAHNHVLLILSESRYVQTTIRKLNKVGIDVHHLEQMFDGEESVNYLCHRSKNSINATDKWTYSETNIIYLNGARKETFTEDMNSKKRSPMDIEKLVEYGIENYCISIEDLIIVLWKKKTEDEDSASLFKSCMKTSLSEQKLITAILSKNYRLKGFTSVDGRSTADL